jgi:hypothetical protein
LLDEAYDSVLQASPAVLPDDIEQLVRLERRSWPTNAPGIKADQS